VRCGVMGGGAGAAPAGVGVRCGATSEGQGITGVCDRGRWLLQARGAILGRVIALPRPAHESEGDRMCEIICSFLVFYKS
jgi:hypothetical protein